MTALTKVEKKDINTQHDLSVIEQVVLQGDLSKLSPEQRVTYYHKVCDTIGLNPFTRPFEYVSLGGKLTLYAKKDATEQLRTIKNISILELEGKLIEDLYIVTAKASTPTGRIDQATGAVSLGALRGEQKANAIMKAETKAKRRVTLSICGLGWTDESEIESIPNAKHVNVCHDTGEIGSNLNSNVNPLYIEPISIQQSIELNQIFQGCSDVSQNNIMKYIKDNFSVESLDDLPSSKYQIMKNSLKNAYDAHQKELVEKEMENTGDF